MQEASTPRWTPSPKTAAVIGDLWDAFEAGDRWYTFKSVTAARMTGTALLWNGVAEVDETSVMPSGAHMRCRLHAEVLAANGYVDRDWRMYSTEMVEARREEPGMFINPYLTEEVTDMDVVKQHKASSTGTTVSLIDNRDGSFEEFAGDNEIKWATLCEDHGNYVLHSTRSVARSWMFHPEEWCENCQTSHGKAQVAA